MCLRFSHRAASLALTALTLMLALNASCTQRPEVPTQARENYPAIIRDSAERREKAEREWRRLLESYQAPPTPPDLYPIIYTPRSLLGVSGGIKIANATGMNGAQGLNSRQAMRLFIDRWHELLGADPSTISLFSADEGGDTRRYTYRQRGYQHPIAGNYGEMISVITADGKLLQLDDRLIPVVELPSRPAIAGEEIAARLAGRTFTYSDVAGREQRATIKDAGEVKIKGLVILPVERADSLEIRLAWESIAGASLTWTVYFDAMSGDELRVIQNFQT